VKGKNKIMMGLLILAAAGLWLYIGQRIYHTWFSAGETMTSEAPLSIITKEDQWPDTFSIKANYRDPFLVSTPLKKIVTQLPPKKVNPPPVPAKPWPELSYGGMIRNEKTNQQLALLTINGRSELVSAGKVYEELEVKKIFKDSIQLGFGKELKMVRK
jgi:hypothetical protein